MAKLAKQMYRSVKTGEKRINCYHIHISKAIIEQVGFKDSDDLKISVKDNKIVIEKR